MKKKDWRNCARSMRNILRHSVPPGETTGRDLRRVPRDYARDRQGKLDERDEAVIHYTLLGILKEKLSHQNASDR